MLSQNYKAPFRRFFHMYFKGTEGVVTLQYILGLEKKRKAWLSLAFAGVVFELIALYFQYALDLKPCVMCIYQRTAMLGIIAAGLMGAIAPQHLVLRIVAYVVWAGSAIKGLMLALEHSEIQTSSSPFFTCPFRPDFGQWLVLDEWLPAFFRAEGDCAYISWSLLGWSMSQWMVLIFASFISVFAAILINSFRREQSA